MNFTKIFIFTMVGIFMTLMTLGAIGAVSNTMVQLVHSELIVESDITYKKDIRPIFKQSCASCHNGSKGLPNLLNYEVAFSLKEEIKQKVQSRKMPHVGRLKPYHRDLIIIWVENGGKE